MIRPSSVTSSGLSGNSAARHVGKITQCRHRQNSAALVRYHLQGDIEPLDGAQEIGAINEIGFPTLRASRGEMRHRPGKAFGGHRSAMRTGYGYGFSICHRDSPSPVFFVDPPLLIELCWIVNSTWPVPPNTCSSFSAKHRTSLMNCRTCFSLFQPTEHIDNATHNREIGFLWYAPAAVPQAKLT
jgi:hypothetical protein